MAGLHPNPHKNWPIIVDDSEMQMNKIPKIKRPHDDLIALVLPQLSEIYGIIRSPKTEPAYNKD